MATTTSKNQPTTLLSLPNELLDQILAELKWGAPAPQFPLDGLQFYENLTTTRDTDTTAAIQNVRLTCRRLAARASPFLLPVASVSVSDPASVARLEEIARHEAFARHVRAVRVCFGFYEAELAAEDVRALAAHLVWSGRSRMLLRDGDSLAEAESESDVALPGGRTRADWRRILDEWDAFCHDDHVKDEGNGGGDGDGYLLASSGPVLPGEEDHETESMRLLRREHAEYRRRYEAQQRLSKSAVERIAGAMARMPRATRLILDDGPEDAPPKSTWLVAPTTWVTAFKFGRGSPPTDTLFNLPAAVHRAGVKLTALRIRQLRLPAEFPLWLPRDGDGEEGGSSSLSGFGGISWAWATGGGDPPLPGEVEQLRAACASLRVFEFTPGYEPGCWPTDSPTHLEWPGMSRWPGPRTLLDDALRWMILPSARLEQVRVDLQMVHGGSPWELAMPNPVPWAGIRVFHLQDGYLCVATLTSFLSATAGTLACLHLDGMHLCCSEYVGPWPGVPAPYSWSLVLDLLRAHCCRRSGEEAPMTVRLRRPGGAEFEDLSLSEADMAHIRALFEPDGDDDDVGPSSRLSAVDRFIQGLDDRNPLVAAGKTPLLYP